MQLHKLHPPHVIYPLQSLAGTNGQPGATSTRAQTADGRRGCSLCCMPFGQAKLPRLIGFAKCRCPPPPRWHRRWQAGCLQPLCCITCTLSASEKLLVATAAPLRAPTATSWRAGRPERSGGAASIAGRRLGAPAARWAASRTGTPSAPPTKCCEELCGAPLPQLRCAAPRETWAIATSKPPLPACLPAACLQRERRRRRQQGPRGGRQARPGAAMPPLRPHFQAVRSAEAAHPDAACRRGSSRRRCGRQRRGGGGACRGCEQRAQGARAQGGGGSERRSRCRRQVPGRHLSAQQAAGQAGRRCGSGRSERQRQRSGSSSRRRWAKADGHWQPDGVSCAWCSLYRALPAAAP